MPSFLGVNLRLPFFIYTAVVALNFLLCLFFIPKTRRPTTEVVGPKPPYLKQLLEISRQHARLLATAGVGQVCVQTLRRGTAISLFHSMATRFVGLTTQQVRTVVMVSSANRYVDVPNCRTHDGSVWSEICDSGRGFCIFATGMVLMPFTGTFTTLLLTAMFMRMGNGIASGTMMTLGADLAPHEGTGEFLGLWRLTGDFGGSAGPVIVGNLADLFGLSYSGFALGGIGYLAVSISCGWSQKRCRENDGFYL